MVFEISEKVLQMPAEMVLVQKADTDTLAHQQFGWRSSLFAADEGQDSQHFVSELTGMSISLVTKKVS